MGTNAAAERSAKRIKMLNTNFKLRITSPRIWICNSFFLFALCLLPGNIFAHNLENFAEIINRGSVEQKRDVLLQIRNLRSAEASRFAVPALKDSSEIVRATAAFSVIFLPKSEAFAFLSPLLQDKSALVRRETAYALGAVGDANALNQLLQIFRKDKVLEVRNAAIVALGEIGDASAVSELTSILQRKLSPKEDFTRRSAARSIGQIAQIIQTGKVTVMTPENLLTEKFKRVETPKYSNLSDAFPVFQSAGTVLIQVLQNPKEADDVKREAAFALGAIGDESAFAVLESNTNAEDYYLAEICRESLLKLRKFKQTLIQNSN
jgi:HEAT repeat protein